MDYSVYYGDLLLMNLRLVKQWNWWLNEFWLVNELDEQYLLGCV